MNYFNYFIIVNDRFIDYGFVIYAYIYNKFRFICVSLRINTRER